MAPKHMAEVRSSPAECEEAGWALGALGELCSGVSSAAVVRRYVLINQQHILNKLSLSRDMHKTGFSIDQLMKMCPEAAVTLPCLSPGSNSSAFTKSAFIVSLQNVSTTNENQVCISPSLPQP